MIVTENQPGYVMEYVYGGAGLFTPIADFLTRVFSSGASKAAQKVLKSTAKKIAADAGKKLLDVGSKKAEQLARDKIKSLLSKKQTKRTLKVSDAPPVASIPLDSPNLGVIPRRRGLNEGLGIKVI